MVNYPNASVYWLNGPCYNPSRGDDCPNNCRICFRKWGMYTIEATNGYGIKEVYDLRLEERLAVKDFNEIKFQMESLLRRFLGRPYDEFVICGQGEPTVELDLILKLIEWTQGRYRKPVRLVTNGQGNLSNPGRDVVGELREADLRNPAVDLIISISLLGYDISSYIRNCGPRFGEDAFPGVLEFAGRTLKVFGEKNTEITSVMTDGVNVREIEELAKRMEYTNFRKRPEISAIW